MSKNERDPNSKDEKKGLEVIVNSVEVWVNKKYY